MIFPTKASAAVSLAVAGAIAGTLAACASPSEAAADTAATVRVMVKLVRSSVDARAISAEAARVAGVPVSYAAATSASWHALGLHCASAAQCDAAIARLRGAGAVYEAVEVEGRKVPAAS